MADASTTTLLQESFYVVDRDVAGRIARRLPGGDLQRRVGNGGCTADWESLEQMFS